MGSFNAMQSLGIRVKTMAEVTKETSPEDKGVLTEIKSPTIDIKGGTKKMAVHLALIPEAYKDVEFDVSHIKDNVTEQARGLKRRFKVKRFDNYIEATNTILSKIRAGVRPDCSYLIGAPNGFGKTSFVNTSIKIMLEKEWNAVPYISLSELAEVRVENERKLLMGIELGAVRNKAEDENEYYYRNSSDTMKMPQTITGRYSWSEYMNSDILFCFFSSLDSKVIESHTLKCILDIRSAKGLPTVVLMSTSLNPYKMDYTLREHVWDEILSYKEDTNCFDRVYHVSCYKVANSIIGDDDLGIGD